MGIAPKWTHWRPIVSKVAGQIDSVGHFLNRTSRVDWGTRRKPLGAIVAWGSLAIFAVLTVLGIAGVVMTLQPRPAALPQLETAAAEPAPAVPVEARLPAELSFTDAQAVAAVEATEPQVQAADNVAGKVADPGSDLIAATFEQLVEPVVVPANQVPEGAVAAIPQPAGATAAVADNEIDLPMGRDTTLAPLPVTRNAAARAIDSEVPDADRGSRTALGYAAQPDEQVRVGDSSINVRSGPSPSNRKLFALAAGAEVDVTGKSGDWVAITDAKDRDGWVDASLLDNLDLGAVPVAKAAPAAEPEQAADVKKVAGSGVTVRSGPGKSHKQLFNLAGGSEVTVLDDSKGWLKIKAEDGRTGWAYQSYIKG